METSKLGIDTAEFMKMAKSEMKKSANAFYTPQGIESLGSIKDDRINQRMVSHYQERDFSYGLGDFLVHEMSTENQEISYTIQEPLNAKETKTYFIENLPNIRRVYEFENESLEKSNESFDSTSNLMSILRLVSEENGINSFKEVEVFHTNSQKPCVVYFPKRK